MNITIVSGRLCADPEIRYTNSNKAVANFTVAVDDGKDKEGNRRTQFVPCVAWDKAGENIGKFFTKGTPITLQGHLSCRTWEKDGTKHYAWEVFVDRWEFVPGAARKSSADAFADIESDEEFPF